MLAPRRLAVLLALALLVAGCFGDDRPVVETAPVAAGEVVETVSAPARVDAAARQDVAAPTSGVVVALEAEDGEAVEGGERIVRLESTQLDLAREQAAAAQSAAAQVGGITVDGGGAATLATVSEAVADLDATMEPRVAAAREEAAALEEPAARAAAVAAVDAVESTYLANRAALLATGESLAAQQDAVAQSLGDALNEAVRQATAAQRAQADAAAAAAAAQADDLEVTAPFDGTIQFAEAAATDGAGGLDLGQLAGDGLPPDVAEAAGGLAGLAGAEGGGTLRVGAPVVAGQTLFTVYDLSTLYVNADVDEVDAPAVAIGQRARVLIDALPEAELTGVVDAIRVEAATTEAGGVGFPTRVRVIGDTGGDLRVGMTASVEITTETVEADLVVPSRALLRRDVGDGDTAVFVIRDGTAVLEPVAVLALGEDRAGVEGNLEEGGRVVVAGYEDLEDGDEVRTAQSSAQAGRDEAEGTR